MAFANKVACKTDTLASFRAAGVWENMSDASIDGLTRLTAELFEAPMAIIVLQHASRQTIRSSFGCVCQEIASDNGILSLIARSIAAITMIADATLDPQFSNHPAMTATCQLRFYAGAPIVDRTGAAVGTICVFDIRPHTLQENWTRQLQDLAGCIAIRLEYEDIAAAHQEARQHWRNRTGTNRDGAGAAMFWNVTANGDPFEVNPLWLQRFGLAPEAAIDRSWLSIVHPEDRTSIEQAWSDATSEFEAVEVKHRLRLANGDYRWFRTSASPVRTKHDGRIIWHGMTEDIHDEVLCHNALRQSEERLGIALAAGKFGFWELDLASGQLISSDSYAQNFGRQHGSELLSFESVRAATHPEDHEKQLAALEHTMATGSDLEVEFRTIWPDRSIHWVRVMARAVGGADGSPLRLIGLSLDITSQRHAEDERRIAEARAIYLAGHDALTGLVNRRRFGEILVATPAPARIAILLLDLDYFAAVNDTFGHAAGDIVIRQAADRIRSRIRETDTASRYGGDGFAVLQTGIARAEDSLSLAERIREAFSQPFDVEGERIMLGVSIGVALATDEPIEPTQLLHNADTALHWAKFAERGVTIIYRADMHTALQARQAITLGLRGALERNEFSLVYEPLIELRSGRIIAFEALLRWEHPLLGVVPPGDFIRIAEETGVIVPIGASVLRRACRDAASWPDTIRVAVNLSPVQFGAGTLEASVSTALSETGLDPNRLELEITEGTLLQDTNANLSLLRALRRLGVHLSLDDFGTGYSSLAYLRRFPVDKIKIDRSLISGLPDAENGDLIVKAIVGLGHSLGITTVSEGIETQGQLGLLRGFGCDQVQGHLFSQPLTAAEIPAVLERRWLD